jgi:hypothetical protein
VLNELKGGQEFCSGAAVDGLVGAARRCDEIIAAHFAVPFAISGDETEAARLVAELSIVVVGCVRVCWRIPRACVCAR